MRDSPDCFGERRGAGEGRGGEAGTRVPGQQDEDMTERRDFSRVGVM